MTGRLAARCVLLGSGLALAPGEIAWDAAGRITSLRRARGRTADVCIVPGLVNAHAHLQLAPLSSREPRFVPWVRAVLAARAKETAADRRAAANAAIAALHRDGVTAVGEIDATGDSPPLLERARVAGRCYRELTGFHLEVHAARALVRDRRGRGGAHCAAGLSPHAPYSVSPSLFVAAARAARHLAVHCAEVPEEQQLLREGRGPFADLLRELGRLPKGFRAPGCGAVAWLERLGVLRPTTQLVHCQELERGDVGRIAAAGAAIVVCPGTIRWFDREPPPVERWLAAGIPVALGTDSRASNDAFSLRAELRAAAELWPGLAPATLLAMATTGGARALGRPGLGRLRRGGRADFAVLPALGDRPEAHVEPFVRGELAPLATFAGGRRASGWPGAGGVEPRHRPTYSARPESAAGGVTAAGTSPASDR